jgi:hypothetical protein
MFMGGAIEDHLDLAKYNMGQHSSGVVAQLMDAQQGFTWPVAAPPATV